MLVATLFSGERCKTQDVISILTCNLDESIVDIAFDMWRSHVKCPPGCDVSGVFIDFQPLFRISADLIPGTQREDESMLPG